MKKAKAITVCENAACPNRLECYNKSQMAFLALGQKCTRSCGFCNVGFAKWPEKPDIAEPEKIASLAQKISLTFWDCSVAKIFCS